MKELTIEEIVFLWKVKYKYDRLLHGFTFAENDKANEINPDKIDLFKSTYGDLL